MGNEVRVCLASVRLLALRERAARGQALGLAAYLNAMAPVARLVPFAAPILRRVHADGGSLPAAAAALWCAASEQLLGGERLGPA